MTDTNEYLRDPVNETIAREMIFFLRCPAERLRAVLPGDLHPQLAEPGVGLIAIGIQHIVKSEFSSCVDVGKLYLTIVLQPRLDLGTATPRFAMFLVGMASDQPEFQRALQTVDQANIQPTRAMRVHFTENGVSAEDSDGPILRLALSTPPPVFRHYEVWNQMHSLFDGNRSIQMNCWTGDGFEHSGQPEVGEVYQHRFWGQLYTPGLGSQGWHQMFMRPGSKANMRIYKPVLQPHV